MKKEEEEDRRTQIPSSSTQQQEVTIDPDNENNATELSNLFGKNLVLNKFSSKNGEKHYVRQRKEIPDLYADPIGMMREECVRNKGEYKKFDVQELKREEGEEITELDDIEFPDEYTFLLSLDALNEETLRPNKYFWRTLMNIPRQTKSIINKEVALICLNWAQSKLDEKEAVIESALLKYTMHTIEKGQFGRMAKVTLELLSPPEQGVMIAKQVKRGAIVKFGSLRSGKMLDIPWAKVKALKNRFIQLHAYIYKPKSPASKKLIQAMTLLDNEEVCVYECQPDFIPQSMLRSIERIKTGTLNDIINPNFDFDVESIKEFKLNFKQLLPTLKAYTGLNNHQSQVLYSICTGSHKTAPYLLNGPPGTGKTRTIATTVKCLLEMDPNVRILLTAPSNMAVDMMAYKLVDQFDSSVLNENNVLRLKSIGSDFLGRDKRLDPITYFDSAAEIFLIPKPEDFLPYRVVLSTLGCSTHIVNRIPPGFFTHIFLDEAGQAGESEIWIPMGGLATKQTSIIICGDPKQLGPVYTLDLGPHVTGRFESALMRYMQIPSYECDERVFCQLIRSYRCHQTILDIASQLFYKQSLKTGILYRNEPFHEWEALPKKNFPMMFVHVNGTQFTETHKTNSYANREEIEVTLAYVHQLLTDFNIKPEDIGIISPYRHQTYLLTQQLERSLEDSRKITVDSVERFQGSERKVIIMTTTRSHGLGFLGCDLRLNTSITRAMNLLIVIGNKNALSRHNSWSRFIDYCTENKSLIEWNGRVQLFNHNEQ